LHRQRHVGAGVAVGDGENVQGVDQRLVGAQPGQPRHDKFLEHQSVNRLVAQVMQVFGLDIGGIRTHQMLLKQPKTKGFLAFPG
jgi:hypothetical protein